MDLVSTEMLTLILTAVILMSLMVIIRNCKSLLPVESRECCEIVTHLAVITSNSQ